MKARTKTHKTVVQETEIDNDLREQKSAHVTDHVKHCIDDIESPEAEQIAHKSRILAASLLITWLTTNEIH